MSRLSRQSEAEWVAIEDPRVIAVLDRTVDEIGAALGAVRDEVDEEGLGQTFYLPLGWDGQSRFLLSASGVYPGNGVAVEVSASESAASARSDLLSEIGWGPDAFLAIAEGDTWFARWDLPHNAGVRPATARPR